MYQQIPEMTCSLSNRVVAFIIDVIPIMVLFLIPMLKIELIASYTVFNWIVLQANSQHTIGKRIMGLQVIVLDAPITYERMVYRYFCSLLSGLLIGFGYLLAFIRPDHQTLHDQLSGTRVIKK